MIQGYPDEPSVSPGETLVLHVSTDAPQFRVDFYRQGETLVLSHRSGWLDGHDRAPYLPYQDWGWPAYSFVVPGDRPSGVYFAMLVQGDGRGTVVDPPDVTTPDARDSKVLFVLKPGSRGARSAVLYKLPLLTYHAYNQAGGWSLYTVPEDVPPAVSIRRPGGGTGGTPSDLRNVDPFDPTPRQTFVHWDAPFVSWLERNGYRVDYCTDLDVHRDSDGELLGGCELLLCAGHDEYWSDAMRAHVQTFVRDGHNAAFFSGNTCWYRVALDDAFTFRRLHAWSGAGQSCEPENSLTGVSYRNGGERDQYHSQIPCGYQVQHADHWVYSRTWLQEGETFGDGPDQHLVGYECDGAEFDRSDLVRGVPVRPTGSDGTPSTFVILGVSDVSLAGWGLGNKAATMGVYTDNGTVFTASTTDWVRVLASGSAPAVEQITRSVLDRLAGPRLAHAASG
jgi:hypothetical protein